MNALSEPAAFNLLKLLIESEAIKLRASTTAEPTDAAQRDAKYLLTLLHLLQYPGEIPATIR